MKNIFGLLLLFGLSMSVQAQEEARFTVEVSTDSILFGNHFKVTFTLENAKGNNFSSPDFTEFYVVSGPNQASSMSIVNGTVSQSISYSYYLEPKEVGNFYILPASVNIDNQILETQPIEIMVVPNPEGIKQSPEQNQGFNMDGFKLDGFDLWGDDMPDLNNMQDLFRQMVPDGDMEGFQLFRDSMPNFNLEEFFKMMPDLEMNIPEQFKEEEAPLEPKRKKKRKIYKI